MEVPLQPINNLADGFNNFSFNPCFNGSSSSTGRVLLETLPQRKVSILVLMEVPLQPA